MIPPAAKKKGLKTAVGAWLGTDSGVNEGQVHNLVALSQAGTVDVAIVGNETLFGGSLDEAALAGWIARVRGQVAPSVPVTTPEPWNTWLEHPGLADSVDLVYVNIHPYWYNVSVDRAVPWTAARYREVQAISRGKPVIISETGWPSEGEPRGDAVPSLQASEQYHREFSAWADRDGIPYFYFEAFDEAWKATPAAEAEAHWGIWYSNGTPKFPLTGGDI
jgi:exo-beta-1,3-glucanase (GH17 family)